VAWLMRGTNQPATWPVAWLMRGTNQPATAVAGQAVRRAARGCLGVWQVFLASAGGCSAGLYARRPLAAAPDRMRRG